MQKNLYLLKAAVRSNQHEMEKMSYLQNICSLGANIDELNIEFENLNIKPQFLIVTETWLREYSNLNIFCPDRWKSIETCNQKSERGAGVAVLSTEQNYIATIKKIVTKIYRF